MSVARRIRTWAAALVAVTGAATMQANADTFYVNGSCGDDAWTGTGSVCSAPNGPKLTIQAGIDASVSGDTVIVADGTYTGVGNKNLDYGGRAIRVRSEGGAAACIIDCENNGRGVWFHNDETADAVLEGFTIRNGVLLDANGGAILCESASPTILNCALSNNRAFDGGGLFSSGGSPTLSNCTISENTADCSGGGLLLGEGSPKVTNCTFSGNSATSGGGMLNRGNGSSPKVNNCILWNDSSDEIVDVDGAVTTVRFSDVQGGWIGQGRGNIDAAPLFVDPVNADYHLAPGSPCIDAARNGRVPAGITTDLDGNPRFLDDPDTPDCQWLPGTCGQPPIVDMGAYEFPCDLCDFVVDALEIDRFKQTIRDLSDLGTRYWSRPENTIAVEYIREKLESFGYKNVMLDPYLFDGQLKHNVYATKIGTTRPLEMYILGAHLDSVRVPGADDDASGVASVLETARVFSRAHTEVSVRFILFNNEETGLNGSRAYVANHRDRQGTPEEPRWLGMIQQDMILYDHGPGKIPDADVEYQRGATHNGEAVALAEFVAGAMNRYGDMPAEVGDNMNFTDSKSFWSHTAAISARENQRVSEIGQGSNPHYHQPTDDFETYTERDYEFGFNITRMVTGAVAELAGARCEPCDMNCDGDINAFDIEPFLDLLFDPKATPCNTCTGDVNGNGEINVFDIEPFLECLFP